MPQLVVVASRSAEKPADVKVRFHATGASGDRVVIVHPGGSAGSALRSKSTDGAVDGTLRFGTDGLAPGSYPAALVHPGRRHRVPVAVLALAAGAEPTVRTSRRLYTSGNPIRVSWTNGPGHEVGLARNLQGRRAPRIRTPRPARPTHVRTGTTSSTSTRTRRSRARRGSTPLRRYRAIRRGRSGRAPTGCGSSWTTATSPSRCRRSSRSSSRSTAAEAGSYFELRILYSVGERTGDQGSRLVALGRAIYLPNRKRPGAGVARVIARTDGAAIPTAQDTTTSTAAVTSTASVPNASDAGPASAWPTGLSPSATSQANESTRESRWLGISR